MNKCWCGNDLLDEYSEDYYVCHKCGTLVTKREADSRITEIHNERTELYGSNYWTDKMVQKAGVNTLEELILSYLGGRVPYWLRYIIKYIPLNTSVAEIGCGLGPLSYILKMLGYTQTAYEISPEICEFIKRKMGLNTVCGEFGSVNEIYESILTFDLLEHLIDPKAFMKECRARLWGKSIFCCQTPCYTEEWTYEEMLREKKEFSCLMVPEEHIFIYSKRSITKLLADAGFPYVVFEPPAFGEYYDLFLFASPKPITCVTDAEIEREFLETPNGLLIKTWLDFFKRLGNT